ncbi:hypothetical protein KUV65_15665 [Maritalea mobilis]|uniref:hypothetical protein n=1 Tax=Maritalea mobilis TaxID=483324 RepID=UPI001C93ADF8|nr:hypothetical protein [Maritalea mobilis]MBY6202812.1 hypothetical protein [Maritalea mobilis]
MQEFETTHSHLYPGAHGVAGKRPVDGPVTVVFADGTRASANLSGTRLSVAAHRTSTGTEISAKDWRVSFDAPMPDGRVAFRVVGRLAQDAPPGMTVRPSMFQFCMPPR